MALRELSSTLNGVFKFLLWAAGENVKALRGIGGGVLDEVNQEGINTPGPDRNNPEEFNKTFDRYSLVRDYEKARKFKDVGSGDNGTVADVILVTRQQELLSGMQRDYMSRKTSRVLAIGLEAARAGNMASKENSPYEKSIKGTLNRYMEFSGGANRGKKGVNSGDSTII